MLFYMLNDENDDVRIMAINALKSVYDPFLINVIMRTLYKLEMGPRYYPL